MGVHGLTTYLQENKRVLATTLHFDTDDKHANSTPIVVDGWSFIYELFNQSRLPWVYGGEYNAYARLVVRVVQAWIAVGFKVHFVFDGPTPQLKFQTVVNRLNQSHVKPSLLFFRTSLASRCTARFLFQTRIIPPLVDFATLNALREVASATDALEIHMADAEGDPYAVELAARVGGYVVGRDSDFVILNAEGYLGYIPIDDMVWLSPTAAESKADDGEFQTVRKQKRKKQDITTRRLIPQDNDISDLTLSVTTYNPYSLASHLKIPVSLLPLLGALVGNDFLNSSSARLFFDKNLSLTQRITHVATALGNVLTAAMQTRKAKYQVENVMDFIEKTVSALLIIASNTMSSGELDDIVDRIVNATLQYAIHKYEIPEVADEVQETTEVCVLHAPDTCTLPLLFSHGLLRRAAAEKQVTGKMQKMMEVRALLLRAYRAGDFHDELTDVLSTGTFWPGLFLESPDIESVSRSISRPIRQWIYAILDDSVGLLEQAQDDQDADEPDELAESEKGVDEVVDSVEESSEGEDGAAKEDYLAPLRGELEKIRGSENGSSVTKTLSLSSGSRSLPRLKAKAVTEYVRRGTRIVEECVTVPDLSQLLSPLRLTRLDDESEDWMPVQLRPPEERFTVLLHALHSDWPAVREVPREQVLALLSLRWVIRTLHNRAQEDAASRERQQERWARHEARAFLACLFTSRDASSSTPSIGQAPDIVDRNIQLMAQLWTTFEAIHFLTQVLLLSEYVPNTIHLFSSQAFHAFLTGASEVEEAAVSSELWEACSAGLDDAFSEERKPKAKKQTARKERKKLATQPAVQTQRAPGGLYGLLAGMDV